MTIVGLESGRPTVSPSPGAFPPRREADPPPRLVGLAERFAGLRIAVIGDVIADEFLYGRPARVSREAPVLILEHDRTAVVPGGAGNAAANAGALGGEVRLVGLVGPGERELLERLRASVDVSRVLRPEGYRAPVKTRILAGGRHTARQQIVRVDRRTVWRCGSGRRRLRPGGARRARRLRRGALLGLRVRARDAGAVRPTPGTSRARAAAGRRFRCWSTRATTWPPSAAARRARRTRRRRSRRSAGR